MKRQENEPTIEMKMCLFMVQLHLNVLFYHKFLALYVIIFWDAENDGRMTVKAIKNYHSFHAYLFFSQISWLIDIFFIPDLLLFAIINTYQL